MSIYMKISGVSGSVTKKGVEKTIELDSYHVGSQRSVSQKVGSLKNRGVGLVRTGNVILYKKLDASSPTLIGYFHQGKVIPKIELHHVDDDSNQSHLINTYSNVILSTFNEQNAKSSSVEEIEFYFTKSEKRYYDQDSSGKITSSQVVGYDLEKAQGL